MHIPAKDLLLPGKEKAAMQYGEIENGSVSDGSFFLR